MRQWSDLPLVLTSDQAAAVLQLKRRTIANMLDRGELRGVKIGKEWRVNRVELIRLMTPSPAETSAKATPSTLINKGGVLVVKAEPLDDLTDFILNEREQRVADLIQQAGL